MLYILHETFATFRTLCLRPLGNDATGGSSNRISTTPGIPARGGSMDIEPVSGVYLEITLMPGPSAPAIVQTSRPFQNNLNHIGAGQDAMRLQSQFSLQ